VQFQAKGFVNVFITENMIEVAMGIEQQDGV
jgi:hypothetical protein